MTEKTPPPFSRPVPVERIKSLGQREKLNASEEELQLLKAELGLDNVISLRFECHLTTWKKHGVRVQGQVTGQISEICVISLEPFQTDVQEQVDRCFLGNTGSKDSADMIDLENIDEDVPDQIIAGVIDLGEIATETLALTLLSHPRKPGAVFSDHIESAPLDEGQTERKNPFDVLKNFKPN